MKIGNEMLSCDETTEFSELAEKYKPLINSMAARFAGDAANGSLDEEDLRQEALIALSRAAETYDFGSEKVTFGLYAKICIRNRLISVARKSPARDDSDESGLRESDDPLKSMIEREDYERLISDMDSVLTPLEKTVLTLRTEDKSYKEIAAELGLREKSVSNALERAKTKLKRHLPVSGAALGAREKGD